MSSYQPQTTKAVLAALLTSFALVISSGTALAQAPPTPPTISAFGGNGTILVMWAAVPGATSYNLYRGTTPGGQSATALASVNNIIYINQGVTNGTRYYYRVRAVNASGMSALSPEASAMPLSAPPPQAPLNLKATPASGQVTLTWSPSQNATSYSVFRGTSSNAQSSTAIATVNSPTYVNTGLTNGTTYFYKVRAIGPNGTSGLSEEVSARPQVAAPTEAPANLTLTVGNGKVTLNWDAVAGATSYRVYRGTATNAQSATAVGSPTSPTFANTGLTNGTRYFYKVTAMTAGGEGPRSAEVSGVPIGPPVAPTGLTISAGNTQLVLTWNPSATATSYNVYRGTTAGGQGATPIQTGVTNPSFINTGLTNGTTYYYKVTAVNAGGESSRSSEASSAPVSAAPPTDAETLSAHRFLRQATFGPKPGDVDRVKQMGKAAFLDDQFNQPASILPDSLLAESVEWTQERWFANAITGPDQLRQRVAFALHKMWVISAVQIDDATAIVPYYRILLNRAFGNYRDLMRDITLNPGMGDYLTMRDNKAQSITGVPPNENYARELLQLFTLGIPRLNQNGTPAGGNAYTEEDVKDLARALTGWTYGDGSAATIPTNSRPRDYTVPMEAVARFHDTGAKTILGQAFTPGQTASQDLEQALDLIFNHPNVGPFVARHFIQTMVTSNPSSQYISDVAAAFNNNGSGVRGDLRAVIRTMLLHPEANLGTNPQGKLNEPVIFATSVIRALDGQVADHPFLTDYTEEMGQKVLYPGSVFSYFSPGYRVRGLNGIGGPEFQIHTSVTALARINFVGKVVAGSFGTDLVVDFTPFRSRAANAGDLVDYCSTLFLGGQMSTEFRNEVINAVQVSPPTNTTERARTALYLILGSAQYQVDK